MANKADKTRKGTKEQMSLDLKSESTEGPTSALIFLHDMGSSGRGWRSTLTLHVPPGTRVICPTAPEIQVSMNYNSHYPDSGKATAWFDMKSLEITEPTDKAGIESSAKIVHKLIDQQIECGIPSNRIALGGFSQGGSMALFAALTYKKPLAGVMAFACWLPMRELFPELKRASTDLPIFMGHGQYDLVALHKYGQISADHLKTFMTNVTFKTYPFLSHVTCEEEFRDIKEVLLKWFE